MVSSLRTESRTRLLQSNSRATQKLTDVEIVNAVDPIRRIKSCPLELSTHQSRLYPLHRRMDVALGEAEQVFRSTTVAEVVVEPGDVQPLCEMGQKRRRSPRRHLVLDRTA